MIADEVRDSLHTYMATVIKNLGCVPVLINSVEDHIHLLFDLGRSISVSQFVEDVKKSSSKWIKTQGAQYSVFAWQAGTELSPFQNRMSKTCVNTSPVNVNIIVKKRLRMNTDNFLNIIVWFMMKGMFGIKYPTKILDRPFRARLFFYRNPRAMP